MYTGMFSREAHPCKRQMFTTLSLLGNGLMHAAIIHETRQQ
jgi:hypothetical protein